MQLCFLLEELKEGSIGLASEFEGTGEVMAGRTQRDWSHCLCSQVAERDECWDSAGFFMLPFRSVQTPQPIGWSHFSEMALYTGRDSESGRVTIPGAQCTLISRISIRRRTMPLDAIALFTRDFLLALAFVGGGFCHSLGRVFSGARRSIHR